jgi:FkbH-like protein
MLGQDPRPANFRNRLRSVLADADPAVRLRGLADLAKVDLGYLETLQLDRSLGKLSAAGEVPEFPRVRIAVLSTSTVDHLLPPIRIAGLRHGLRIETYTGSFGQYRQELLDPQSGLRGFHPDTVLLSLTARQVIGELPLATRAADADRHLGAIVEDLRTLWRRAREGLAATVVQQSFLDTSEPLFGSFDRLVPGAPARLVSRLNDLLADAVARDGVLWLDVAAASARDGLRAWFDVARWLQGKMEVAPQAAPRYGDLLARLVVAQRGQARKCLVFDLDNTLWGGVVGDDGVDGIVLGEGSAAGEAHLALQHYARRLAERGVILAVCSKNDPAIAMTAFQEHPEMVLKISHLAALAVNWEDKATNLRRIAEQLNIGLDSLVFVDDNPTERARVRESLPMVAVPELPADPAGYVSSIAEGGWFEAVGLTEEDLARTGSYAANARREAVRSTVQSVDDFLRGLDMSVSCGRVSPVDQLRVAQLVNKTNQFNPTTRRYAAEELAQFCTDPANVPLQFHLADRFGDNGLVSVMLLRPLAGERGALEIECWVMSCRVFGRQLEHEAMNFAVTTARDLGVRTFVASYHQTAKNGIVARLYPNLGFAPAAEAPPGGSRWRLELDAYEPRRTFIARRDR